MPSGSSGPPGAPRYTKLQRRLLTLSAGTGVVVLAGVLFVLTYDDLRALALAGRAAERFASAYPIMYDALVAVTILSLVVARHARWWSRWWRWLLLLALVGGAAAASVQRAIDGYDPLPDQELVAGVAGAPHAMLVIAVMLWITMFRQARAALLRPVGGHRPADSTAGTEAAETDMTEGDARAGNTAGNATAVEGWGETDDWGDTGRWGETEGWGEAGRTAGAGAAAGPGTGPETWEEPGAALVPGMGEPQAPPALTKEPEPAVGPPAQRDHFDDTGFDDTGHTGDTGDQHTDRHTDRRVGHGVEPWLDAGGPGTGTGSTGQEPSAPPEAVDEGLDDERDEAEPEPAPSPAPASLPTDVRLVGRREAGPAALTTWPDIVIADSPDPAEDDVDASVADRAEDPDAGEDERIAPEPFEDGYGHEDDETPGERPAGDAVDDADRWSAAGSEEVQRWASGPADGSARRHRTPSEPPARNVEWPPSSKFRSSPTPPTD